MTPCSECGRPTEPDVAHHRCGSGHNWLDETDWCDCQDLCAACCGDPDCPTREPQENP